MYRAKGIRKNREEKNHSMATEEITDRKELETKVYECLTNKTKLHV